MDRGTRAFRGLACLALALLLQQPLGALAQTADGDEDERTLAPGDEIALTVPGRPELDGDLVLDAAGRVSIEQVGEVPLVGLTIEEAGQVLRQRLRLFFPNLADLEVELKSASEIVLYAIGAVREPGQYEFAHLPTIWELVRSAGGPAEDADLTNARVVRQQDGVTSVHNLDLSGMMTGTDVPGFQLRSGDTLAIPGTTDGGPAVPGTEGVQVLGGVSSPTTVQIKQPTPLIDVIVRAGAPLENGNLEKVWWVHSTGGGYVSTGVNVRDFLEDGDPRGNPLVHPGDTVEVEFSRPGWFTQYLPLILGTLATTATVALAIDRLTTD